MNSLVGTGGLIRLILRRDRVVLPVWIGVAAMVPIGVAAGFLKLYATPQAMRAYAAEVAANPTVRAMLGPVFTPTLGGLTAWRTGMQGALATGIVSLLLVVRHTRTEEETGRRELLGSTVVGRQAALAATLFVVLVANLILAALIGAGLVCLGLPAASSIVFGLSWVAAGWEFAAVGALTAQLTENARGAVGIGLAAFAVCYMVRMAGDAGGEQGALAWISWLSPLGWTRLTAAYANDRLWVFALILGMAALLIAAAFTLSAGRDLGAGVLSGARLGPASAKPGLNNPLALAWRLHRGTLFAWTVGALVFGCLLGMVGRTMTNLMSEPRIEQWLSRMGSRNSADAFLVMVLYALGQVSAGHAIQATLRMRSEEDLGRAESVLAGPISRNRWAGGHLVFAALGPLVVLAALGLATAFTYVTSTGGGRDEISRLVFRAIVMLPAVWVIAGLTFAMFGIMPRFAFAASWSVFASLLLLELGWEMRQVSQGVFDLSPFAHVHWATPEITFAPLLWLTAIAALLTAAGFAGFGRRDIG